MIEIVKADGRFMNRPYLAAPAALLGSSIGAFAALKSLDQIPLWAVKLIETQAVGMLGFLVLLGCMIYFAPQLIRAFNNQATAMTKVSSAMDSIAERGGRIDEKVDEILINQRLFVSRLDALKKLMIDGR